MKVFHTLVFVLIYLREIVLSTARIGVLVLSPKPRLNPCFVEVPLDLQGELPRFLFACLISMTPGSMSVGIDHENNRLSVHLIDAPDPAAAVVEMKNVFEQPLIRIFGRA
jgi:multisubunit Na+/H+ antiporter MnhE subunit